MIKGTKIVLTLLISILLLTPISSALISHKSENDIEKGIFNPFTIQLSEENIISIEKFIANNCSNIQKTSVESIINKVITQENKFNVQLFINLIEEQGIQSVFYPSETIGIEDDILNFLLQMIEDRIGWVYEFYQESTQLIYSTKNLWDDRTLPQEIINELTTLINKLEELQILLTTLINKEYMTFLKEWSPGLIIQQITEIVESIESIARDIGILVGDIQQFIYSVSNFINWFSSEPWKQPIHIYGQVIKGVNGVSNITVTCNEVTSNTNETGFFDFYIEVIPSNSSIPPDSYYGLHNCIISIDNNGETISSPSLLSYVFSDGGIYWLFIISNGKKSNNIIVGQSQYFYNCYIEIEGEITNHYWPRIIGSNMWKMLYLRFKNNQAVVFFWQLVLEKNAIIKIYSKQNRDLLFEYGNEAYPQIKLFYFKGTYIPFSNSSQLIIQGNCQMAILKEMV